MQIVVGRVWGGIVYEELLSPLLLINDKGILIGRDIVKLIGELIMIIVEVGIKLEESLEVYDKILKRAWSSKCI